MSDPQETPQSNLFSTSQQTPETEIEKKLQVRQEKYSNSENFTEIKQSAISNELNRTKDERTKIFMQRRLKQKITVDKTESLRNRLTIPIELYDQCNQMTLQPEDLMKSIELFRTEEISSKYKGLVSLRKMLSFPTNPPIQEIIDFNLVSDFINLLTNSYPEFQYEALWCLTNIASGTSDQANTIIVKGGLNQIISLVDSPIEELQNQAVWTIGNLAGDSSKSREQIIQQKGFEKIINVFSSTQRNSLIRNCTWAISNFLKIKPIMKYENCESCIIHIIRGINLLSEDIDFLIDACWVLSFMTENYKKSISVILDSNILPLLFKFLNLDTSHIVLSVLRIIGNIASGNANQTQLLIDNGVLNYLKQTIYNQKKSIRKESAWILSNIAAGTQKQIEILINENFLPLLNDVIKKDDSEIQKEAIWAVCNLTSIEKPILMQILIEQHIIELICDCLKMKDAKYLAVSLEAFGNLLNFGKKYLMVDGVNKIVTRVEELGMFDVLESLQYHPVEVVYEKTIKLLETYFETENTQ